MRPICFSFLAVLLSNAATAQQTQDEAAIRQVVQTIVDGWTNTDGKQFASAFADEHDYIVWSGYYFKGMTSQLNAQAHQRLFETVYPDTKAYMTVDKIKFIREDIALIHVLGAIAPKAESRPKDPQILWTGLLEKTGGKWQIVSFHNLDLEVFKDEQIRANAPMPVEVMYAGWYGEGR